MTNAQDSTRRDFLGRLSAGVGLGLGVGLTGCTIDATNKDGEKTESGSEQTGTSSLKPLRALFSNAGLQSSWCTLGKRTAELWGQLLNVEIEWKDGEFDPQKQRDKIDAVAGENWDFCCFQAVQTDSLAAPVRKLKEKGIPVISMDTLIVAMDKMRETGVWVEVMPDQVEMGVQSTQYLMDQIGGKGKVIHIGGLSAHSGAQGREEGFNKVLANYPEVQVVGGGVRWCDWKKEKARNTFESLLQQETEPIAGAFFHSDDMALACLPVLANTIHKDMIVTAVDGQKEGLNSVKGGGLAATTVNPVCRIHRTALIVGQFIARNKESMDKVPLEIITPGPLVARGDQKTLDAMFYLADEAHCIV